MKKNYETIAMGVALILTIPVVVFVIFLTTKPSGDSSETPNETAQSEPTAAAQSEPTAAAQPEPTAVAQPEPTAVAQSETTAVAQPEPSEVKIEGEVFISTKDGKTSMVAGELVRFYKVSDINAALEKAKSTIPRERENLDTWIGNWSGQAAQYEELAKNPSVPSRTRELMVKKAQRQRARVKDCEKAKENLPYASQVFSFLPSPSHTTRTTSGGGFGIVLPNEEWVAVVEHVRQVRDHSYEQEEYMDLHYYWAVPITSEFQSLTNHNMITSQSQESILRLAIGFFDPQAPL